MSHQVSSFLQATTPYDEAARDHAVINSQAYDVDGDPVLTRIVVDTRKRFGVPVAFVSIVRGASQRLIAADGVPPGIYDRRLSLCGHSVIEDRDVFSVADLATDARFAANPWVDGTHARSRFYAAAMLRFGAGYPIGPLCIVGNEPRQLKAAEVTQLRATARSVTERLERLRMSSVVFLPD